MTVTRSVTRSATRSATYGATVGKWGGYVVEYVGVNEFWIKTPVSDLGDSGAIGYQFIRASGGSGATDTGAPWDSWRRVGVYGLPSIASAHNHASRVILSSEFDLGARDYAFYSTDTSKWVGSYHGGETVDTQWSPEVGVSQPSDGTFRLARNTTLTDGLGNAISASLSASVLPDGRWQDTMTFVSAAAVWGEVLVAHEIMTSASQYSTDGGATFDQITVNDKIEVTSGVILRNPGTGHEVQITSDAGGQSNFWRHYIRQHTGLDRIKFYSEFDPATTDPLTINPVTRVSRWYKTAPDPVPPLAYDAERDGLTPLTIHAGSDKVSIDTATTPDTLLLNGDATGAPFNRVSAILGISEAGNYRLVFNDVSLSGGSNGGTNVYITKATDGSSSTPTPLVTAFMGNVAADGYLDFTISDVTGNPIRVLLRQTRASAAANRCRIGAMLLQRVS
jgi:hypothetical protein